LFLDQPLHTFSSIMKQFVILALFVICCFAFRQAPLLRVESNRVDDSYIVVFKDSVGASRQSEIKQIAAKFHESHNISFEYTIIPGFAAKLTKEGVAYLQTLDEVDYIEEDQMMFAFCDSHSSAIWNLARISTSGPPIWNANTYETETDGVGTEAFIIDTGILTSHTQFAGGRARQGANFVTGETPADCNGHGTQVASTVAGATYGVAKAAGVVGVKVLSCAGSGTTAGVIAGVNWVAQNAAPNQDTANMSLGGGASATLDQACNNLVSAGIFLAVAAGNSGTNACNTSPARAANAFTLGATEQPYQGSTTDGRTSWSNFGTCLKAFAPGESILGAWIGSNGATNTISGTSMASPHACGVANVILGRQSMSPTQVRDFIINNANTGTVSNPGAGSPNVVVYNACDP